MKDTDSFRKIDPLFCKLRPGTHQALQTQGEIVKAALALFNERGASSVTTHEIAEKAGISPGNLYYHFKNKEEIIRAIFWRIDLFSRFEWAGHAPANPKENMTGFMRFIFGELTKYRFFFREFAVLLKSDEILAKLWDLRYGQLYKAMRETAQMWVDVGVLRPFKSSEEIDSFIENFWVLANFAAVHLENRKPSSKPDPTHLLIHYLYPYHTLKGQRVLDLYL